MSSGSNGAWAGAGQAIAKIGEMSFMDSLESMRQERLAAIQSARDDKQMAHQSDEASLDRASREGMAEAERASREAQADLDRKSNEKRTNIEANARKEASGSGGATEKTKLIEYLLANDPDLTRDAATQMALDGKVKLVTDKNDNTILLEIDKQGNWNEVGSVKPGKRNKPQQFVPPADKPEQGAGMLDQPMFNMVDNAKASGPSNPVGKSEQPGNNAPDPASFAQVKGDFSKYSDGEYTTKDGRKITVKNGVAYIAK